MSRRSANGLLLGLFCASCGLNSKAETLQAPFTVSDYFMPSGYFGDGALTGRTPKSVDVSYDQCAARPPNAQGSCYRFTYRPVPASEGGKSFGGVYWQSPANNWGQDEPLAAVPNATRATFYAAGAVGGERVTFTAGGLSATEPDGAPLPYVDTVKGTTGVVLTTVMTQYEVPLPAGASYDHVLGAFAWAITAVGTDTRTFYLDDVQWVP